MSPAVRPADNKAMEDLSAADIISFRKVYQKVYGVRLTDKQVCRKASRLIKFMRASQEAKQQRLKIYGAT